MITDNELLSIELRNKGNADVEALLREIRDMVDQTMSEQALYDNGYEDGIVEGKRRVNEDEE